MKTILKILLVLISNPGFDVLAIATCFPIVTH